MAVASGSSEKESDIQKLKTRIKQLTTKVQDLETNQSRYRQQNTCDSSFQTASEQNKTYEDHIERVEQVLNRL